MRRCHVILGVLLLSSCTNDAAQIEKFLELEDAFAMETCICGHYDPRIHASFAECVGKSVEFDPADVWHDCHVEVYSDLPSYFDEAIVCNNGAREDTLDCTRAAVCDRDALSRCEAAEDIARDACPEVTEDEAFAYLDQVFDCIDARVGPPEGVCPSAGVLAGSEFEVDLGSRGNDSEGRCGGRSGADVSVEWTAGAAGTYSFDTAGSEIDTVIYVLDGCGGTELACNDDDVGEVEQARVEVTLDAGQTVIVVIDGFSGLHLGQARLTIRPI